MNIYRIISSVRYKSDRAKQVDSWSIKKVRKEIGNSYKVTNQCSFISAAQLTNVTVTTQAKNLRSYCT